MYIHTTFEMTRENIVYNRKEKKELVDVFKPLFRNIYNVNKELLTSQINLAELDVKASSESCTECKI